MHKEMMKEVNSEWRTGAHGLRTLATKASLALVGTIRNPGEVSGQFEQEHYCCLYGCIVLSDIASVVYAGNTVVILSRNGYRVS